MGRSQAVSSIKVTLTLIVLAIVWELACRVLNVPPHLVPTLEGITIPNLKDRIASGQSGASVLSGASIVPATNMLRVDTHLKIVSECLRHSELGLTLDLYCNVVPNMQEDAAARIDDAQQAALHQRRNRKLG